MTEITPQITLPPEIWRIILKNKVLEGSSGLLRHVCRLFRNILKNKPRISRYILSTIPLIKWARVNRCPWNAELSQIVAENGHL